MKLLGLITILSIFAIGCAGDQQEADKTKVKSEVEKDRHDTKKKLELNNGTKWKADSSTNYSVRNLQATIEKLNSNTDRSISTYQLTSAELQAGLDKMIAECKMKGPDHDALHKWLEPLIGAVNKLKGSTNEHDAAEGIKVIDEHLKLYAHYFE